MTQLSSLITEPLSTNAAVQLRAVSVFFAVNGKERERELLTPFARAIFVPSWSKRRKRKRINTQMATATVRFHYEKENLIKAKSNFLESGESVCKVGGS